VTGQPGPGEPGPGEPADERPAGLTGPAESTTPAEGGEQRPVSGLRNPAGAVRGAGAAALVIEAVVLLLAIQPIRMLAGRLSGWGVGAILVLVVLSIALAGLLKRRWAWYAAIVLQVLVIATGVFQYAIAVIGVIFAAIWLYVLYLRRTILGVR
jgi:hypothetical protein